jgi:phosphohistidine phosphatase SixA
MTVSVSQETTAQAATRPGWHASVRLEDYPIERIMCSPTRRCRQTVEPLARDRLDWPKGSTWLLERTLHRQVRGRFLAPLTVSRALTS